MNIQAGERYKCSDANCACEIEVTNPSRMQEESFSSSSMNARNADSLNDRSPTNQAIGGPATGETGAGSLRKAESAGISTPGDFGSQGATGEGVFGTSGGNQRSTASGRLGSTTGASTTGTTLKSGSQRSNTSSIELGSAAQASFYCVCGQPMHKAQPASRAARM